MTRRLKSLSATAVALVLGLTVQSGWADDEGGEIPFADAHLFFELNNTDGDLGIHALIDGEPWKNLTIEDPKDRKMLNVRVRGRLRRQGLTEIFFESAEPTFDELSPADFFARFPADTYEISGRTLEGDELESETELTHVIPAPPGGITLNGIADPLAEGQCDDEDPAFDPPQVKPADDGTVTIAWAAVTQSHPDIEEGPGVGLGEMVDIEEIENYEVVVEVLDQDAEMSVKFPGNPDEPMPSVTITADLIALGGDFKYEILAREPSYNQTATESCFVLVE